MATTELLKSSHPGKIIYRPEIDGLRALAIIPVVLFHLGQLSGGFVGVDVFFVISGYLITAIILAEHRANQFTFSQFWMRRVRRIIPGLLLLLLVVLIAGRFILVGSSYSILGWQGAASLTFSANIYIWQITNGYWGLGAESLPLLHTWSLSVEEQFYLLYPLLLISCLKHFPKKVFWILLSLTVFSLVACLFITRSASSLAFYLLPTRAWELSGGGLLAIIPWFCPPSLRTLGCRLTKKNNFASCLAGFGLVLMVASWFVLNQHNSPDRGSFPGYKALMPVVGAMLIIGCAGGRPCPTTTILSHPLACFIGKISYSLYLWHWPVIVLCRLAHYRWQLFPESAGIILTIPLSLGAYYLVELPGRRYVRILPLVILGALVALSLSLWAVVSVAQRQPIKHEPTVWMGNVYNVSPIIEKPQAKMKGIEFPMRPASENNCYKSNGIVLKYGGLQIDAVVVGNSHALMWAPVIDKACKELGLTVSFMTADGVPPIPTIPPQKIATAQFSAQEWFDFDSNRLEMSQRCKPRFIIIAARWSCLQMNNALLNYLKRLTDQGSQVLLIEDPPELEVGDVNVTEFMDWTALTNLNACHLKSLQESTVYLDSLTNRFPLVHTLKTADLYLSGNDRVRVFDGKSVLYIDDNHLSVAGAYLAGDRIKNALISLIH